MATLIELNDSGIQVFQKEKLVTVSPGYAVLDGNNLLIGNSGAKNARRLPRWTNNKYWNQLGTDAIANGTANIRHHADLAFAHLEHIASQLDQDIGELVFAVPGYYSKNQLALLLGMANECQLSVKSLVDTGLISVATPSPHSLVLHLDIHLHRIVLSTFRNDGLLRRAESSTVTESGLFTLWDRWANIIADQFIQSSRFDPMYQAESEQALYDQLPEWIKNLGTTHKLFELQHKNVNYSVNVSPDQLLSACTNVYPQIIQAIRNQAPTNEHAKLYVSHRFKGFPGFSDSLALLNNVEVEELRSDAVAQGTALHLDKIMQDNQVAHITSLPLPKPRSEPAESPVSTNAHSEDTSTDSAERAPTHLLLNNHASAIGERLPISNISETQIEVNETNPVCVLYRDNNALIIEIPGDTDLVLLNDKSIEHGTKLSIGNRLTIGEATITLISVTP